MSVRLPAFLIAASAFAAILSACGDSATPAKKAEIDAPAELVIYSARNEQLIGPLLEEYQALTGVRTRLVTAKAGPLLERLKAEADSTPADLLLTVDAGNLWQAAEAGLLKSINSPVLTQTVPEHLRDPENRWFGLSVRARTIVHHPDRAPADSLSSYAALAAPSFKGRLCLRTSRKVYNQSLVAMMIAEHGVQGTEKIVRGWVDNLAAPPFSNDTAVMEAIMAGQCDVGIVNTYYYGRLQKQQSDLPVALFWADQKGNGVHVNISGAGIVKAADQPEAALELLEWLASAQAQSSFAGANQEYPVNPAVDAVASVKAWGAFKPNLINVAEAGRLQAEAVKLMDRAGYR